MQQQQRQPSRLERLEALRDSLEAALGSDIGARDLASVSREYRAVLADIEAIPAKGGSPADEIAERRARRRAAASGAARAEG